ncbi:hypothetical protein J6590_069248 [Homalodisca vitripennis]|nr:hypothetical protein J6590_069248 [Homalodisca vitripennis]
MIQRVYDPPSQPLKFLRGILRGNKIEGAASTFCTDDGRTKLWRPGKDILWDPVNRPAPYKCGGVRQAITSQKQPGVSSPSFGFDASTLSLFQLIHAGVIQTIHRNTVYTAVQSLYRLQRVVSETSMMMLAMDDTRFCMKDYLSKTISERWVLRFLTEDNKNNVWSTPRLFWRSCVAILRKTKVRILEGEREPKKAKTLKSAGKVMATKIKEIRPHFQKSSFTRTMRVSGIHVYTLVDGFGNIHRIRQTPGPSDLFLFPNLKERLDERRTRRGLQHTMPDPLSKRRNSHLGSAAGSQQLPTL